MKAKAQEARAKVIEAELKFQSNCGRFIAEPGYHGLLKMQNVQADTEMRQAFWFREIYYWGGEKTSKKLYLGSFKRP